MQLLQEMFSHQFIIRALIVGGLVSLCAALLGVTLVLKRFSMIGDGLAHVGFGTLSAAMALNLAPLQVSIPVMVVVAFFLLRMNENTKIKGDSAIALISSTALAFGVIVTSLTKGMNMDVVDYLFGSIYAIEESDVYISIPLSIIVLVLYIVFYHNIFAITFDENFAKATGTKSNIYKMMIAFLTAITIVVGMRIMGTLLISSLIVFPSISAMRVCKNFKTVMITSAIISVLAFFFGVLVSFYMDLPAGASIIGVNVILLGLFYLTGLITKRA